VPLYLVRLPTPYAIELLMLRTGVWPHALGHRDFHVAKLLRMDIAFPLSLACAELYKELV